MICRYLIKVFLISLPCFSIAQKSTERIKWIYKQRLDASKISYGVYVGLNYHDFQIAYKTYLSDQDISVKATTGTNLGFLVDYKINDYFYLRLFPTWLYTERTLFYPLVKSSKEQVRVTRSDYISLPLLLKINTKRYYNYRLYIDSGMSFDKDFTSKNLINGNFLDSTFYRFQIGGGFEIYFRYLKITLDFRGVFPLSNEIEGSELNVKLNQNIKTLRSRAFLFGIIIQ